MGGEEHTEAGRRKNFAIQKINAWLIQLMLKAKAFWQKIIKS
jgi:hypothetical protein